MREHVILYTTARRVDPQPAPRPRTILPAYSQHESELAETLAIDLAEWAGKNGVSFPTALGIIGIACDRIRAECTPATAS